MDDWERIDKLEKDVKYLEDIIFNHLTRSERIMEHLMDVSGQLAAILKEAHQETSTD